MKKTVSKRVSLIIFFAALLVVCVTLASCAHVHAFRSWKSDGVYHWKECSCGVKSDLEAHFKRWVVDRPATISSVGSKHEECPVCRRCFDTATIDRLTSTTRTADFYAVNDFHGEADKISKIGGYLTERRNSDANTLLLSSGDMFRGTVVSGSNKGRLLTDCMAEIGFDGMTLGNHEFDWGVNNIRNLSNFDVMPFLGANIYKWNANTRTWGDFASDVARQYIVKTLDNGLKVGVIGVIGGGQTSLMFSPCVQTIGFKNPLEVVPEVAADLRNNHNCDLVVLSAHVGPQRLVGEKENHGEPSTTAGLENYVDAVFCAHTHRAQSYVVNGLPFIQGNAYGNYVSHVRLSVDANGNVACEKQENVDYSDDWNNLPAVDRLVNDAYAETEAVADEILCNIPQPLGKSKQLTRLTCRAVAQFAAEHGQKDIVLAMVGGAHSKLEAGTVTYAELYKALPFQQEIYIAEVSGSDLIKKATSSDVSIWRVGGEAIKNSDTEFYKIAVSGFMLFHQNANRRYNYFPSAFKDGRRNFPLTDKGGSVCTVREVTRDYMRNSYVNPDDYIYDNVYNDADLLLQTVNLQGL